LNSFQSQGQADLIKSYLALGDNSSAEAAVEKLMADFSWSENIARAIHDTAWEYRKLANYSRANELDQYVIDRWPEDVQAMWAKMDMAKTDIVLGNYTAADKTVDILIADFNDLLEMPTAIFMLGEQYYNKAIEHKKNGRDKEGDAFYQKAIVVWEKMIQKLPPSTEYTPRAYWCSAVVYSQELRQYAKGIEYYQEIIDNWPTYEYTWHAQLLVGRYYEKLRDSGGLPESEANPKIEHAYKSVIENYPDSDSAPGAALNLGRMYFKSAQWADAAHYFELFVQIDNGRSPNHVLINALYDLGKTYEQMGNLDMAVEMYRVVIESAAPDDPRIKTVQSELEKLQGSKK